MSRYVKDQGDKDRQKGFNDTPPEDEMLKYKNFGKLIHNHQKLTKSIVRKPLYRDWRTAMTIILILVVALLIYLSEEG